MDAKGQRGQDIIARSRFEEEKKTPASCLGVCGFVYLAYQTVMSKDGIDEDEEALDRGTSGGKPMEDATARCLIRHLL